MLVLTRKLKQQIQIGADITITVLRVQGNNVRIGIDAPQNVRVMRGELPIQVDLCLDDEPAQEVQPAPKTSRKFTTEARNPGETSSLRTAPLSSAVLRRRGAGAVTTAAAW